MATHNIDFKIGVIGDGEKQFRDITKESRKTTASVKEMRKELETLVKKRDAAKLPEHVRKLNREIEQTEKAIKKAESSTNVLNLSMGKLKVAGVAAATAVAAGIYKTGKAAITASSQMEKYQVTLKTMLGSTKAAGERMAEYMDIAKITPFQLSEVVEGGNQLQAMGRYSRENLEMLGDLAAASGKPLQQVMGAYGKLASGQKGIAVDMFRDLLITTNDWVEATGKGVEKSGQLKASVEDMMKALPKIMEKKGFMGLMAAQAETTEGKISNLEDAVFGLSDALGERMQPTVKSVVGWLTKMTGKMEDAVRIPTAEKIAREKVELNYLVGELMKANKGEEDRNRWLRELNQKYPEFLRNIDLEKGGNDALLGKLKEVNAEYDKRILKAAYAKQLESLDEDAQKEMDKVAKHQISLYSKQEYNRLTAEWAKRGYNYTKYKNNPQYVQDLAPKEQAMYYQIKELDSKRSWSDDPKNIAKAKEAMASIARRRKVIEDAMAANIGATDDGTAGDGDGGGSTGTSTASGESAGDGGGGYAGGGGGTTGGGRNVTTKIGTLVGVININTTNLTEGAAEVKRLVAQALTEAIPSN